MQEVLEKAARWYIEETGFGLEAMQKDLRAMVAHRDKALREGTLEQINKAFIFTEIIKAAICLTIGEEYETSFSRIELGLIRKYAKVEPEMFTCKHCGRKYPAYSFAPGGKYCIRCAAEIKRIHQAYAARKRGGGYLNAHGELICAV